MEESRKNIETQWLPYKLKNFGNLNKTQEVKVPICKNQIWNSHCKQKNPKDSKIHNTFVFQMNNNKQTKNTDRIKQQTPNREIPLKSDTTRTMS